MMTFRKNGVLCRARSGAIWGIVSCIASAAWASPALSDLIAKAERQGTVRVIVALRLSTVLEGELRNAQEISRQQDAIRQIRQKALGRLPAQTYRVTRVFETIPYVAMEATPESLRALQSVPEVLDVGEDRVAWTSLVDSAPLVRANLAWAAGFSGAGQTVAILDTGIDKAHPFLADIVVAEACFSVTGSCPSGGTSQIGAGAGVPCTYSAACSHGTHVAGIVAGRAENIAGVAPGASLIAVQVFSRLTGPYCDGIGEDPCALSLTSDRIAALEWVYSQRSTYSIAAVNMSLGGERFDSFCDSAPAAAAEKAVIDNLRAVGIATVVASGNESYPDSVSYPACISSAISVGATTKNDAIAGFSNSARILSLLAPGESILSSLPGSTFGFNSGTSMATPHVAGAWAVVKEADQVASVSQVLDALTSTGVSVRDGRNGLVKPRIDVYGALPVLGSDCSTTQTQAIAADSVGVSISGTRPAAAASQSSAIVLPKGIPTDGKWTYEKRLNGESWSYQFNVSDLRMGGKDAMPADSADSRAGVLGRTRLVQDEFAGTPPSRPLRSILLSDNYTSPFPAGSVVGVPAGNAPFSSPRTSRPLLGRLAGVTRLDGAGLPDSDRSGFELDLRDLDQSLRPLNARVRLEMLHPAPRDLTVWLSVGVSDFVLWRGSDVDNTEAGLARRNDGETIIVDRVLGSEIAGLSASTKWSIWIGDSATHEPRGRVQDAALLIGLAEKPSDGTSHFYTFESMAMAAFSGDIQALSAYLRTSSADAGSTVTSPVLGQPVYAHLTWQIPGIGDIQYVSGVATMDGALLCSGYLTAYPGYQYVSWCSSGWTATAGSHVLRWDLDVLNEIIEVSEINNAAAMAFVTQVPVVDLEARRAYMRTAADGGGAEVLAPAQGQTVYFHLDWRASGSTSALTAEVRAVLDGGVFCSGALLIVPGFDVYAYCTAGWPATAGSHTLRWELDYPNWITESNEANNVTQTSINVQGLDVEALRTYARTLPNQMGTEVTSPAIGQSIYPYLELRVLGANTTVPVSARTLIDNAELCAGVVDMLPGFTATLWCMNPWVATPGVHVLRSDVDYTGQIAEVNESNNGVQVQLNTRDLDIAGTRTYFRTGPSGGGSAVDSLTIGQPVYAHLDWQVQGSGAQLSVSQRAVLDGITFCACRAMVAPGASLTSSCNSAWEATPGTHTLRWDLDYTDEFGETNETNNVTVGTPTVLQPPCPDVDGDNYAVCNTVCGPAAGDACGDCDDAHTSVHPGALEICDALNNNCDQLTDDGFPDVEGDNTPDCRDNCDLVWNPDQADADTDATGDACEPEALFMAANLSTGGFSSGRVDGRDLALFADVFGTCPQDPGYSSAANLDRVPGGEGACIDGVDFILFLEQFAVVQGG